MGCSRSLSMLNHGRGQGTDTFKSKHTYTHTPIPTGKERREGEKKTKDSHIHSKIKRTDKCSRPANHEEEVPHRDYPETHHAEPTKTTNFISPTDDELQQLQIPHDKGHLISFPLLPAPIYQADITR